MSLDTETRLTIVSIADLHFGKNTIHPEKLYQRLNKYLYPKLLKADILFIAGDLFDRLLSLDNLSSYYATLFIQELYQMSIDTGLIIRTIFGTFSHDRNQPKYLEALHRKGVNSRVITDIEVETISLGPNLDPLRVVYVPDSLAYHTSDAIVDQIKELFRCVGWTTADLMIGHGQFDYAVPDAPINSHMYRIEQFTDLIDGQVIMGHIHTPSRRKRVTYVGSFDRMCHGEEGKKGFLTGQMSKQRKWSFQFVENPEATLFNTLRPMGDTPDDIIADFRQQVQLKFPEGTGYVRVIHSDSTIRSLLYQICNKEFPELVYTAISAPTDETDTLMEQIEVTDTAETLVLDLPNLTKLIYQTLQTKSEFQQYTLEQYQQAIKELGVR